MDLPEPPPSAGPQPAQAAVREIIARETVGRDTSLSRLSVLPPPRPAFRAPAPASDAVEVLGVPDYLPAPAEAAAASLPAWPWSGQGDLPSASDPRGGQTLQSGVASWYGPRFHGRKTASGERFNQNDLTAAHRFLPFGTKVRVVDQTTGRSVIVRINDRGPYGHGRVIDLSKASAEALGLRGLARVKIVSAE